MLSLNEQTQKSIKRALRKLWKNKRTSEDCWPVFNTSYCCYELKATGRAVCIPIRNLQHGAEVHSLAITLYFLRLDSSSRTAHKSWETDL